MKGSGERGLARPLRSGVESGVTLGAASVVAIALNYGFLLASGRLLGSGDYGALAALLGFLTVVLLPTGAVQLAVSREISRRMAIGDKAGAHGFGWAVLRLGLIATAPMVALGLALAVPLKELLNIESTGVVVLAAFALLGVFAFPIATGVLQGHQRFFALATMYVFPFAIRLGLLVVAAAGGLRLGGAVFAAAAASIAASLIALALVRDPLRRGARAVRPSLGPFLRYLGPVVVGLTGIAVLTNVDLIVVKARFAPDDAGGYAAASAFARVAFFLPATILTVLFPRTAARQARGEATADILGRSLFATAAFGGLLTLFYAMSGRGLVHTSFGREFAEGGELLAIFSISMTLFAFANILLGFHLSRGETYYAWIVAVIVPVQVALVAVVPADPRGVIWMNIGVGIGLLVAHEMFVESSLPALRAGWQHVRRDIQVRRSLVVEALATLIGFTALVLLLMWPLASRLNSAFIGTERSDAAATIASLWRSKDDAFHIFGTTARSIPGVPIGWEEANGPNLQVLLAYYPAHLASKILGEIAAYNLVVVSGYVLSGAAMFLLARFLGCSRLVSSWAGLAYVIFPWHLERAVHASLVHIEVLALLVLGLVAAAERPVWTRFAFVGLLTLGAWLTTGYLGVMAAIGAAAFAVSAAWVLREKRAGARLVAGATGWVLTASLVVAALSFLSGFGRGETLERQVANLWQFGLRLTELVVPSEDNILVGERFVAFHGSRVHGSFPEETSNYLGLLTITLALAWLVIAWRRRAKLAERTRAATAGLVGLVVTGLLFALPSPFTVLGYEVTWTPSRILWELIPAFRVPTRWIALVMTALIPLAALTLEAATKALQRRSVGRWRRLLPAVVVLFATTLSVLELAVDPTEDLFKVGGVPPRYDAVGTTRPGTLAEYPLVPGADYSFWQRVHERPLLNTIPKDSEADQIRRALLDPGAPGTASQLALLGVTAIVTHPNALDFTDEALYFGANVPDLPDATWGDGYELVARLPDKSSVWRVVAQPAPALVTLPGGFADPTAPVRAPTEPEALRSALPPGGQRVHYALVQSAGVGYFEFRAYENRVVRLSFDAIPPEGGRRVLRVADPLTERPFELVGRTRISLLTLLPRGLSRLLVKTDPAPTGLSDAIVVSAPWIETAVGPPELRAQRVSDSDP